MNFVKSIHGLQKQNKKIPKTQKKIIFQGLDMFLGVFKVQKHIILTLFII